MNSKIHEEHHHLYKEIINHIISIDVAITHRPINNVNHNHLPRMEHDIYWKDLVDDFIMGTDVFYLSDGGYSRLACDANTGKLFLTSNSLDISQLRFKNIREENIELTKSIIDRTEDVIKTLKEAWENG